MTPISAETSRATRRIAPRLQYWETHGGTESPLLALHRHVRRHGLPDPAEVRELAIELSIPEATVRGVASYYADLASPPSTLVCEGTSCRLAGSKRVREQISARGEPCRGVYCLGYCDRSPAVLDMEENVRLVANDGTLSSRVAPLPEIRCTASRPLVTNRLLEGGAPDLATARVHGAYDGFDQALRRSPGEILEAVEGSGLRGRGGAGFLVGAKWRTCAETDASQRYVIANGDEGDPGAFVDRTLMEEDPHGLIEGMLLCGYAVGASKGIVYVRSEYPQALRRLRAAVADARREGLLGHDISGSGFDFEVEIFPGMGSYVCGEETALINAIEGLRGEVQIRPPYPAVQGLYGCPTAVNNVETLISAPFIVREGPKAYRSLGTPETPGTKVLCLNHGFARPGMVEVEFGVTLREVVEELGGGGRDGAALAAIILGGPMGSLLTPADWDVPICLDAMGKRGIELGHGGIVAVPEDADFRGLLEHWIQFMVDESCGKCVPCRLGSQCAANALEHIHSPEACRLRLEEIFTAMEQGSLCAFGQTMPAPMRQLIEHFGERIFQP